MPKVDKLIQDERLSGESGGRFQFELASYIRTKRMKTVVETGYGLSTLFILHAMEHGLDMEDARLYSIDPAPWYDKPIASPNHEMIFKKSCDALPGLFVRTGPWDLFLHDSNHDILCMTYELNFAFDCLKDGGVIACDDYTWANHGAWDELVKKHNLESQVMGSISYATKHGDLILAKDAQSISNIYLKDACDKEAVWLAKGNKNSPAFAN